MQGANEARYDKAVIDLCLGHSDIITIGEYHNCRSPLAFLINNMQYLSAYGVRYIFTEKLISKSIDNPLILTPDDLNNLRKIINCTSDVDDKIIIDRNLDKIDTEMDKYGELCYSFYALVIMALKCGISVIGINFPTTQELQEDVHNDDPDAKLARDIEMNNHARDIIRNILQPTNKAIIHAGVCHVADYKVQTRSGPKVVPGLKREFQCCDVHIYDLSWNENPKKTMGGFPYQPQGSRQVEPILTPNFLLFRDTRLSVQMVYDKFGPIANELKEYDICSTLFSQNESMPLSGKLTFAWSNILSRKETLLMEPRNRNRTSYPNHLALYPPQPDTRYEKSLHTSSNASKNTTRSLAGDPTRQQAPTRYLPGRNTYPPRTYNSESYSSSQRESTVSIEPSPISKSRPSQTRESLFGRQPHRQGSSSSSHQRFSTLHTPPMQPDPLPNLAEAPSKAPAYYGPPQNNQTHFTPQAPKPKSYKQPYQAMHDARHPHTAGTYVRPKPANEPQIAEPSVDEIYRNAETANRQNPYLPVTPQAPKTTSYKQTYQAEYDARPPHTTGAYVQPKRANEPQTAKPSVDEIYRNAETANRQNSNLPRANNNSQEPSDSNMNQFNPTK